MKAIINTRIVLKDHIIPDGTVLYDGERIVDFGRKLKTDGMEVIDAEGAFVGPGLIEVHTHADGDHFFYEEPEVASATLLKHGVTDVLPALYFNMKRDELIASAEKIRAAMKAGKAPNIIGLYMEAPYLNPKFGCDRENNPWKGEIDEKDYLPLIEAVKDLARVWCVAPERPRIEEFVRAAKQANPNVVFSVAHSEAEPFQIERLMKYGLRLATHHTNATGTIHKYPECRGVCVDETALYNDSIYTELICDKVGIHVDPYLQRLVRKIKGDDKIILISDSFVEHGPIPAGYEDSDDINFDFAGEIAGTRITLDCACRNIMNHTGASVCEAFRFASTNPATMLGLSDRGSIEVGNLANLILTDGDFHVRRVILRGKTIC